VHPALFWCFGRKQAEQQMAAGEFDELDDEFVFAGGEPLQPHRFQP